MKKQYQIKIKLLSDGCPSSGEVYNSTVDVEIDYDSLGFPYLSAKRIKGCLRETALFLREWGMDIPVEEIFGKEGNSKGNLRLESAKLEDYESMRAEIEKYKGFGIGHPQNVLKYFSYIRTQTAMENGVAKSTSLRVLRVLKKGLVFEANISIDEKYKEYLANICKCTRNIGLNRTRGLGEVEIFLVDKSHLSEEKKEFEKKKLPEGYEKIEKEKLEDGKYYRLFYRLRLLEPVILKTADKGQEKTEDYIQGAKILGVLAGKMGNKIYQDLTKEENMICSNLYIADDNIRHIPAPASMCYQKDQGTEDIYDLAAGYQPDVQVNGLGNKYISEKKGKLSVLSVNMQIRYHHSRPDDKSVGRARGDGKGELYQLSSLTEGQIFAGFIQGNKKQIEKVIEQFKYMKNFTIGYGNASEYGKVELYIDGVKEYNVLEDKKLELYSTNGLKKGNEKQALEFLVYFVSPVIVYNDMGMCSYQIEDIRKEMIRYLNLEEGLEINEEKIYLSYTIIGGWQTMWKRPKQIIRVLDKGTVLTLRVESEDSICLPTKSVFLGERTAEGYGEVKFLPIPEKKQWKDISFENQKEDKIDLVNKIQMPEKKNDTEIELIKGLKEIEEKEFLKKKGREAAEKLKGIEASTVNRLLLTLQEQKTKQNFFNVSNSIRKENKKAQAEEIKEQIDKMPSCIYVEGEKAFYIFTKALLLQLKYKLKAEEGNKNE
ncbi:MAG: RAMP superfamily CRISPR-associated protein [Lachnospiraceae bacterium]